MHCETKVYGQHSKINILGGMLVKKVLLNIYRGIVGNEFGWNGEGNEQWYYFLALVINNMLTWWLKPELGIVVTVASAIHFITVCVYAVGDLSYNSVWHSIVYYAIHAIMFGVCALLNWKWTILTSLIVVVAYLLAPDCMGNNIFMRPPKECGVYAGVENIAAILFFHTVLFVVFVAIALSLPISLWVRILIIVACMILHPIIDFLEGECIIISDVTEEAYDKIVQTIKERKDKENS